MESVCIDGRVELKGFCTIGIAWSTMAQIEYDCSNMCQSDSTVDCYRACCAIRVFEFTEV